MSLHIAHWRVGNFLPRDACCAKPCVLLGPRTRTQRALEHTRASKCTYVFCTQRPLMFLVCMFAHLLRKAVHTARASDANSERSKTLECLRARKTDAPSMSVSLRTFAGLHVGYGWEQSFGPRRYVGRVSKPGDQMVRPGTTSHSVRRRICRNPCTICSSVLSAVFSKV